jgi:hypothetical protein
MKDSKKKQKRNLKVEKKKTNPLFVFGIKNILALLIAYFIVNVAFKNQSTYEWVYSSLLKSHMEEIKKNPKATFDERMVMKLGFNYAYLKHLEEQTPEEAVILYPDNDDFHIEGGSFSGDIGNKLYALRFLYPRKLVLKSEIGENKYANEITHVAIVNGRGFEELPYRIENMFDHGVLPVNIE